MTDAEIAEIWRKHQEVHSFAYEIIAIERERCAQIAETAEPYQFADLIRGINQTCPPCNHKCEQGRYCPTRFK